MRLRWSSAARFSTCITTREYECVRITLSSRINGSTSSQIFSRHDGTVCVANSRAKEDSEALCASKSSPSHDFVTTNRVNRSSPAVAGTGFSSDFLSRADAERMFSMSSEVVAARERLTRSESAKMAAIGNGSSGSFANRAWYESMMSKPPSELLLLDANCAVFGAAGLAELDAVAVIAVCGSLRRSKSAYTSKKSGDSLL